MEEWVPLLDLFFKSPSPETEASLWLDQASSSSSSAAPINRTSFLSLLLKHQDSPNKVLFIETLPNMVQSRILSLLRFEYQRFCVTDLVCLAREMLGGRKEVDFWVRRAAHNLLDTIPQPKFDEEFDSVPDWLTHKVTSTATILPWLPLSCHSDMLLVDSWNKKEKMTQIRDNVEQDHHHQLVDHNTLTPALEPDVHQMSANLRAQITSCDSTCQVLSLCDEIRKLCLKRARESFQVLALIEPWNADDETAAVFLSNLHTGDENQELGWSSQLLCSIVLPKFLALGKSPSRVLMSATVEYCKIHQRAAEYALVLPLILKKQGINNFVSEVLSRVLKECWHLGHISAFFHKLLCASIQERSFLFLPCHRHLISDDLTWNESLFVLFHNILIHGVSLTQDSVDYLVSKVHELAQRYSKSLKFGNFLLHFTAKCAPMLQDHKYPLIETVNCTNSLVTKSILSKLNAL